MSWSFGATIADGDDVADVLNAAQGEYASTYASSDEAVEQQVAAVAAAVAVASTVTGNLAVNMSGHANPEHKPTLGWANDWVTVNVKQV